MDLTLQFILLFIILLIIMFVATYFTDKSIYKVKWRQYIQKCLEENREPTMNFKEFIDDLEEKQIVKYTKDRAHEDKYYDDIELWMKKLKKK